MLLATTWFVPASPACCPATTATSGCSTARQCLASTGSTLLVRDPFVSCPVPKILIPHPRQNSPIARGSVAGLENHSWGGSWEWKFWCKSLFNLPLCGNKDFQQQYKARFIYSAGLYGLAASCPGPSLFIFFFLGESHCHFDPPWVLLSWNCSSCILVGGMPSVWQGWILRNSPW